MTSHDSSKGPLSLDALGDTVSEAGEGRSTRRPEGSAHPSVVHRWLLATRPATLGAAVAPVLVGAAAASRSGFFDPLVLCVTLAAALSIQIGTNLANDLWDFQRGADTAERLGPLRVTQSGLITPRQVRAATYVAFGAAALGGSYLAIVGGWPIITIGVLSIIAGVTYTAGPWPLGYHGLGDVVVFVFFGLVAVAGTYFVQVHTVHPIALAAAVPVGLLVTAILVVNNLRDIATDRRAGKYTLAVRLGEQGTRIEYVFLVAAAYAMLPVLSVFDGGAAAWLPWFSVPLAIRPVCRILAGTQGSPLNPVLRQTAGLHLTFGMLLAAGLLL